MNTIIEKIRAEVERLYDGDAPKHDQQCDWEDGYFVGIAKVLDILDNLQEQPVKIDIRKELASIEFMGVNDARDSETIARHFYELGKQSKKQLAGDEYWRGYENGRKEVISKPEDFGLCKKQPVCERLEEEIERYLHSLGVGYGGWVDGMEDDDLRGIARHFAKWGAEHLKK